MPTDLSSAIFRLSSLLLLKLLFVAKCLLMQTITHVSGYKSVHMVALKKLVTSCFPEVCCSRCKYCGTVRAQIR
jgi:hypothetical protein